MSEGLNRVTLLGNLGADPELRHTQGGQAVLSIRLATTESWFDKDSNARKERTDWHSVTLWGKRGEALSGILRKGSQILIEGRLSTSSYEKDGEKRYKTEVVANNVVLVGGRPDGAQASRYGTTGHGASAKHAAPDDGPGDDFGTDQIPF